jgi:SAM-dependent methyltransferase
MDTGFESIDDWYEKPLGRLYLTRVIEKLKELLDNQKVKDEYALDAGCGAGHYTLYLAEIGYRAIGFDKSEILIFKAFDKSKGYAEKIDFVTADISSLPFPSDFFKLIICCNVIEFISVPEEALGELRRVLAPQGVLILGVCNKNSIWGLIQRLGKPFHRKDPFFKGRFFSRSGLINLVSKMGFELVQIKEAIYFPPVPCEDLAILCEKIGKRYFRRFPACLIAYLKKSMSIG